MLLVALLLLAQAGPVPARTHAQATSDAAAPAAVPLLHDTRRRPVMNVMINDRGPFPMVVDTAAQTSLISAPLASELRILPLGGGIDVAGATGGTHSRLYPIDRMTNPLFDARNIALVELPNAAVTDARGIVGMERFASGKLTIDRMMGRITTAASSPAPAGYVTIRGNRTQEGFVAVPMTLDGVAVPALVDSGASVTVVNAAAFKLLGWADDDPRINDGGELRGASAGGRHIRSAEISKLMIGRIVLSNVTVIIDAADQGAPSAILGSDLLNLFRQYTLDFPRAELQISAPSTERHP